MSKDILNQSHSRVCEFSGCDRKHKARGLCVRHYQQLRKGQLGATRERTTYKTPEESFAARAKHDGQCLVWTGYRNKYGYGMIGINGNATRAHRYAWERKHGQITDGLHCLHRCNRGHMGCVDVEHLYLGTPADNARDKVEAGRSARHLGARHGRAMLTDDIVTALRIAASRGMPAGSNAVAEALGVHPDTMRKAINGHTWSHLPLHPEK